MKFKNVNELFTGVRTQVCIDHATFPPQVIATRKEKVG
jgi:hypothetical protein